MLEENASKPAERQFVCVSSEHALYLSLVLVYPYLVYHTLVISHECNYCEMESTRKAVTLDWYDCKAMRTTDASTLLFTR